MQTWWEADARHREIILKHPGLEEGSKALCKNGYKEETPAEGEPEEGGVSIDERRTYRGLAARIN